MIIDSEQWHKLSSVLTFFIKSPVKIGFGTNTRKKMYTHSVDYSQNDYEMISFHNLTKPLMPHGSKLSIDRPFIFLKSETDILQKIGLNNLNREKYICVFAGASRIERRWSSDRFSDVAKYYCDKGYTLIIVGSSKDSESAVLIKRIEPRCIDATVFNFSLAQTAQIIARSKALLTGDTGLLHIAFGLGTPTVSLFGAGIQEKWAPRGESHQVINKNLECSPCTRFGYTPKCPYSIRCLTSITAEEVIDSMNYILAKGDQNN